MAIYPFDGPAARLALDAATLDILTSDDDQDPIERFHEAHGGDENPDRDDCPICIRDLDRWMRFGVTW